MLFLFAVFISIGIFSKYCNTWINTDYNGTIKGIFPNDFFFGYPQIKLSNGDLIQLGIREESMFSYIQIGDSIVKNSGSAIVSVFRKDENGNWVEKEFDCK